MIVAVPGQFSAETLTSIPHSFYKIKSYFNTLADLEIGHSGTFDGGGHYVETSSGALDLFTSTSPKVYPVAGLHIVEAFFEARNNLLIPMPGRETGCGRRAQMQPRLYTNS